MENEKLLILMRKFLYFQKKNVSHFELNYLIFASAIRFLICDHLISKKIFIHEITARDSIYWKYLESFEIHKCDEKSILNYLMKHEKNILHFISFPTYFLDAKYKFIEETEETISFDDSYIISFYSFTNIYENLKFVHSSTVYFFDVETSQYYLFQEILKMVIYIQDISDDSSFSEFNHINKLDMNYFSSYVNILGYFIPLQRQKMDFKFHQQINKFIENFINVFLKNQIFTNLKYISSSCVMNDESVCSKGMFSEIFPDLCTEHVETLFSMCVDNSNEKYIKTLRGFRKGEIIIPFSQPTSTNSKIWIKIFESTLESVLFEKTSSTSTINENLYKIKNEFKMNTAVKTDLLNTLNEISSVIDKKNLIQSKFTTFGQKVSNSEINQLTFEKDIMLLVHKFFKTLIYVFKEEINSTLLEKLDQHNFVDLMFIENIFSKYTKIEQIYNFPYYQLFKYIFNAYTNFKFSNLLKSFKFVNYLRFCHLIRRTKDNILQIDNDLNIELTDDGIIASKDIDENQFLGLNGDYFLEEKFHKNYLMLTSNFYI